jgi:hypothetical protein
MNSDLGKRKNEFLIGQAIANAISAAFQHAGVYVKGLKDNDERKVALRMKLADELRLLSKNYVKTVIDDAHCKNIVKLADTLTCEFKGLGILRNNRFRIGIAQKALNLYLKYLWCFGDIVTPPHCPIDRRIIGILGLTSKERGKYDWTKLDDIEKYKILIEKCRSQAEKTPVAEWELNKWKFIFS